MKKFLLSLMLLVMFAPFALHADEIIVGNGTSNTNMAPFGNSYVYSWTEMIYQSSEIGQACDITSLSFQCATTGAFGTMTVSEMNVYLAEVTKSQLANGNFTPESDLTLVYSGTNVVIGDEEWETLTLDTPFSYSGNNNLVIVISKSANGNNMNIRWTSEQIANSIMFDFSDSEPNAALFPNASGYTGGNGYLYNQRPIVKLGTGATNPGEGEGEGEGEGNENIGTPTHEIVVGTGSSSGSATPFRNTYKYSWCETIYPKGELCEAGTIYSIAYHCATVNSSLNYSLSEVDIYLAETSKSMYASSSDWTPESELTLVYSGSNVQLGEEEWETFVFDTPFEYSGDNNLVIVIGKKSNTTTTASGLKWYFSAIDEGNVLYTYSDDISSYGDYPTGAGYDPDYKRANVKIGYTPAEGGNEGGEGNEGEGGEGNDGEATELFAYDFNDGAMTGWRTIDQDGDSHEWQIDSYGGVDGTPCLYSETYSWTGGSLTPDNIIVTENAYTITDVCELSWYTAPMEYSFCNEHYAVVVSTDNETFTNVWEETLTPSYTMVPKTLDLSAYAGQTVYVGFRHYDCNGDNATGLLIDSVVLTGSNNNEGGNEGEGGEGNEGEGEGGEGEETEEGVVFFYDFNDGTFNGMTSIDKDGDGIEWMMWDGGGVDATYAVSSWTYGMYNPENYLITSETYTINNGDYLEWYISTTDATFYQDIYGVVVSTDGENFTTVMEETFAAPTIGYEVRTADLSEYAGQTVHIGFVHKNGGYDSNGIGIDNVKYVGSANTEDPEEPVDPEQPELATSFNFDFNNNLEGWNIIDVNGDTYTWEISDGIMQVGSDGTKCLFSLSTSLQPNDYVVTESAYSITETSTLSFEVKTDNKFYPDYYSVEISEDGENFTVVLEENAPENYTTKTIDLSEYAGKNLYIAFHHFNSNYCAGVLIDNAILSTEGQPVDPEVAEGDTWENAIVVSEYPFTSTPDYANLNNDYTLPGETEDGADAVYKLTFTEETTFNAAITGANGKLALYAEDFNGEDGPGADNYYVVNTFDPNAPTSFEFTFDNEQPLEGLTLIDADGDGLNWELEPDGPYGYAGYDQTRSIMSYSWMSGTGAIYPDNYIVTEQSYGITSQSVVSLNAKPASDYDIYEHFGIVVSEDGVNWTVVYEDTFNSGSWVNPSVSLSDYANKNLYVGVRHFNCNNVYYILVDNFTLTSGNGGGNEGGDEGGNEGGDDNGEYATSFSDDFNDNNINGWRTFQYDSDSYNWELGNTFGIAGPDNSTCLYSLTYAAGSLTPDNFIVTTSKYAITSASTFTFNVSPMNYSYIYDKYGVVVSEDNESWTVVYSEAFDENSEQGYVTRTVNLNSYAGKNVYIGMRHYDCDGDWGSGVLVDNIVLSDGAKRNGGNTLSMTVPAGTYYLAASATEAFSVNIDVETEPQIAKVSFEVEVINANSAKTTARPNEFTAEYHYSVYEAAEVEAAGGVEALALELREDETPYTEVDVWTWEWFSPETEYYIIGTAMNAAGEWGPTTFLTFTTPEEEIEYGTAEVAVETTTINATSVTVATTANENTNEYHIGTVSKALFDYMGEEVIVASLRNDGNPHTGNNEHTFDNLNASTEYVVVVTANNEGGEWGTTTIISFTTLDSDPEPQIAEVAIVVDEITATSVKTTATPNEFAVGYTYSIYDKAEVDAAGADAIAAELQAEGISYTEVDVWTWNELTPETEYYFIGTAQNAAGEWGPTTVVSFSTTPDGLIELNGMVSVYPNPATSVIFVKYDSNAQVSLIDMTGRCVKATEISGDATINVEDLEKGMYIIKIQDGDNTMIHRVVVK